MASTHMENSENWEHQADGQVFNEGSTSKRHLSHNEMMILPFFWIVAFFDNHMTTRKRKSLTDSVVITTL